MIWHGLSFVFGCSAAINATMAQVCAPEPTDVRVPALVSLASLMACLCCGVAARMLP